jgi:ABC-type sugar transport system substrate-binding protein
VSLTIGKPIRGGVVGGLQPVAKDYGATAIDSKTGKSSASGDISAADSLASYGQTLLAAVGVDPALIAGQINAGKVVSGVLT